MLAPNRRSLYVESLVPPLGFELRDAVATSYSVNLDTLLGVPLHLALAERSIPKELDAAALAMLAALRRLAGRITVFYQAGLAAVPAQPHVLYALLEPLMVEVRREGGAFHPKLWVLRFDGPEGQSRIRLIVPTRNLTPDRCWDASLVLEGVVSGGPKAVNAPLARLVAALPTFALQTPSEVTRTRVSEIAEDIRRTEWEAPPGWEVVGFHVNGLGHSPFPIEPSDELLVISPFVSIKAVEALAATTKNARALVSRPEELAKLSSAARDRFKDLWVLSENAGADPDGEAELESRLRGLHAKVYVATTRSTTDLWVGSANATTPGLVDGRNVEILVQLRTKGKQRPIEDFLGEEGMGPLLEAFDPATEPSFDSPEKVRLDAARESLSTAALRLRALQDGELWRVVLESEGAVPLPAEVSATAWPVSVAHTSAVDVTPLREGVAVALPASDLASLTGLVAFEIRDGSESCRFVRNLQVIDMPAARDAELLHAVIGDRDRFLSLMLALFGDGAAALLGDGGDGTGFRFGGGAGGVADGSGLLEHLVRACATDRARLREAVSLVASLRSSARGAALVPEGFPELLALFEEVSP